MCNIVLSLNYKIKGYKKRLKNINILKIFWLGEKF